MHGAPARRQSVELAAAGWSLYGNRLPRRVRLLQRAAEAAGPRRAPGHRPSLVLQQRRRASDVRSGRPRGEPTGHPGGAARRGRALPQRLRRLPGHELQGEARGGQVVRYHGCPASDAEVRTGARRALVHRLRGRDGARYRADEEELVPLCAGARVQLSRPRLGLRRDDRLFAPDEPRQQHRLLPQRRAQRGHRGAHCPALRLARWQGRVLHQGDARGARSGHAPHREGRHAADGDARAHRRRGGSRRRDPDRRQLLAEGRPVSRRRPRAGGGSAGARAPARHGFRPRGVDPAGALQPCAASHDSRFRACRTGRAPAPAHVGAPQRGVDSRSGCGCPRR